MELFAADGHDAGGCERVTGKSGMRPLRRYPISMLSLPRSPALRGRLQALPLEPGGYGGSEGRQHHPQQPPAHPAGRDRSRCLAVQSHQVFKRVVVHSSTSVHRLRRRRPRTVHRYLRCGADATGSGSKPQLDVDALTGDGEAHRRARDEPAEHGRPGQIHLQIRPRPPVGEAAADACAKASHRCPGSD